MIFFFGGGRGLLLEFYGYIKKLMTIGKWKIINFHCDFYRLPSYLIGFHRLLLHLTMFLSRVIKK